MNDIWDRLRSNPNLKDGDLVECVSSSVPRCYKPGVVYRVNFSRDGQRACVCGGDPMGTYPDFTGVGATWKYAQDLPKVRKGFAKWVKEHA